MSRITALVGVYDADHTLRGELAYWVGARLGRRHCALCDITHGLFRRRADWDACAAGLPVAFESFHRDDQPDDVRGAARDVAPVVVVRTTEGLQVLLAPAALEACDGSPDALVTAIEDAAAAAGLTWV